MAIQNAIWSYMLGMFLSNVTELNERIPVDVLAGARPSFAASVDGQLPRVSPKVAEAQW